MPKPKTRRIVSPGKLVACDDCGCAVPEETLAAHEEWHSIYPVPPMENGGAPVQED